MVRSTGIKDAAWLWKLPFTGMIEAKLCKEPSTDKEFKDGCDFVMDQVRLSQGFDYADDLERGLGPGLASSFLKPGKPGARGEQRFRVHIDRQKKSVLLITENGEKCLEAQQWKDSCGFDIFAARHDETGSVQEPHFTLTTDCNRELWALCCLRCQRCEARCRRQSGSMDLARIRHYQEQLGEGQTYCMDIELPRLNESHCPEVICGVCSDPSAQLGHTVLTTRRPKWNPRTKSLTLDFRGRCKLASAKNFQLELLDKSEAGNSLLLFGKLEKDTYVLDFQHPLGVVHAFAAALSSMHWR